MKKTVAHRVPKSIKAIQAMQIKDEEIFYLVEEMGRLHQELEPGEVDWYSAMAIMAEKSPDDHERIFCIMERMQCLMSLLKDERMRGWTMKGIEEGSLFTNEAIFRAVARCPLQADKQRMWFNPEEFFKLALRETDSKGRA